MRRGAAVLVAALLLACGVKAPPRPPVPEPAPTPTPTSTSNPTGTPERSP